MYGNILFKKIITFKKENQIIKIFYFKYYLKVFLY